MNRFLLVNRPRIFCYVFLGAAAAGLASCKRLGDKVEITETREVSSFSPSPHAAVPDYVRFHDDPPPEPEPQIPLIWDTPMGWKEAPAGGSSAMAGMRLINLAFGPNGEGECYLSLMPGAAGGLEANVNRWRSQMGQPPMTREELAKLPTKTFLNRDATFVSIDGDYKAMGATDAKPAYRMMGVILLKRAAEPAEGTQPEPEPEFTLFVKMTGPKDLVVANEAAFDQFCQSISIKR